MNLTTFNMKHNKRQSDETRKRISETMKHTGMLWRRYLELKPEGYAFDNCKQFRTYLKRTNDSHLLDLLNMEGDEQCQNL